MQINTLKLRYPNLNTANTYIFLSVGGNDILQLGSKLTVSTLFKEYEKLVSHLLSTFNNAQIRLVNIYYPQSPLFKKYYGVIEKWNALLAVYANKNGLDIVMIDRKLTDKNDFIMDIEPSQKGARIISKIILRNI